MIGNVEAVPSKRTGIRLTKGKLIGYVLTTRAYDPGKEATSSLERKANKEGFTLQSTEWDVGTASNPLRVGLWRTLRQLICLHCDPRRMPYSILNYEDFLHMALAPCVCKQPDGADGIVLAKIDHFTNDMVKGTKLVLTLARAGKHVIADDGICVSCCHPATRKMMERAH